jgi:hypothetical protein
MSEPAGRLRRERDRLDDENRDKRFTFSIPLRPQEKPLLNIPDPMKQLLHKEYMSRYLETLGVAPTKAVINKFKKNLPLSKMKVAAAWVSQGSKSDQIMLSPLIDAPKLSSVHTELVSPDQVLADTLLKEDVAFAQLQAEALKEQRNKQPDEDESQDTPLSREAAPSPLIFCFYHFNLAQKELPFQPLTIPSAFERKQASVPLIGGAAPDAVELRELVRPFSVNQVRGVYYFYIDSLSFVCRGRR